MLPTYAIVVFLILIAVCLLFLLYNFVTRRRQQLVKNLYVAMCAVFLIWPVAVLAMSFTRPDNTALLFVWDSLTYIGVAYTPVIMLLVAMVFASGKNVMPKYWRLLFIVPTITNLVVWTNPLHHLQYVVFSVIRSEIVFGPYIYVSGVYTYLCLIAAIAVLIRFAVRNNGKLYRMQAAMLALGGVAPLAVSILATFTDFNLSIAATPASFYATLLCNYIAIYRLHLLDIVPIATQHVLDWIQDGYLVLNEHGLVVDENRPFREVFGKLYGIAPNRRLVESMKSGDVANKTALYNLISAVQSCETNLAPIAYEQAVTLPEEGDKPSRKYYYMAEITPLDIEGKLSGFVVIFKDITQVKKSMQQVQEGQARMMEQERLALLGQMVGGLAHNLKTPIMSIAGCTSAVEMLVREARESLGDEEVTPEDYHEIYDEMVDWVDKIRSSCAYMSDIITAIKGQAANVNTSEDREFALDDLFKRTVLLMRHELVSSGCTLIPEYDRGLGILLHGDINNLIQVMNNLISNAIDAEKDSKVKEIRIGCHQDDTHLSLYVRDTGKGVEPRVRERLFQEMITTKGAKGTGLGLYISNSVVRGKFGGYMWVREAEGGGSVFGFSIPLENISIIKPINNEAGETGET